MTLITRSRGRNRSFGAFTPSSLFLGGIQGAWYDPSDNATMFQDAAGLTPVTAVEQPVGSILDKRALAYSNAFTNAQAINTPDNPAFILGSGNFTVEAWVYSTVAGGSQAICAHSNASGSPTDYSFVLRKNAGKFDAIIGANPLSYRATSTATIPTNTWTHVAAVRDGGTFTVYVNGVASGSIDVTGITANNSSGSLAVGTWGDYTAGEYWNGNISNVRLVVGTAVYTSNFTPPTAPLAPVAGTVLLTCGVQWAGNPALTNQGATVSGLNPFTPTLSGNHAFQSTAASRPVLRARYNLLTYSEQFDNAAWLKTNCTIASNTSVAPDGTTTADTMQLGAGTAKKHVAQAANTTGSRIYSIYVKYSSHQYIQMLNNGDLLAANFDIQNGVAGTTYSTTSSITSVGNGWYRCTMTHNNHRASDIRIYAVDALNAAFDSSTSSTGAILLWGAQLLTAADATATGNAYQRVGASTDYATGGVFRPYLAFDGVDDALATNAVDFTATDKMSVFAGANKTSDAAFGVVAELSATIATNNGSFLLSAPNSAAANYNFSAGGTARVDNVVSTYAAPITNVITGLANIAAPSNQVRINGASIATVTTTQGTGAFGNYPMYFGRRNNATDPFNGRIYGLIVRGAASSTVEVAQTESWLNAKTGAY